MSRISFFWKIFISMFIVTCISLFILAVSFRLSLPRFFFRHMGEMNTMMRPGIQVMGNMLENRIFQIFGNTTNEALWISIPIALIITLLASWLISRQISAPLRNLFASAQSISDGNYQERVKLPANLQESQMDEIQRLSSGFNQMAASLERTEEMRKQLIADISHELRTPLTTIKGSIEGLIDGVLPAQNDTYEHILTEATRLQRLVDDLQELSRLEGGSFSLVLQNFPLQPFLEKLIRQFQPLFERKGVHLSSDFQTNLGEIKADPDRLNQILINLLTNGLNYTPENGNVTLSVQKTQTKIQFQVIDNGVGIAPEHLPHIFTRFYRADKSRSRTAGGSGIGLTITKHLVEAHGGSIQAFSDGLEQGSRFVFHIPLKGS